MGRIFGTLLIVLCSLTLCAPAVFGRQHKTVFLKDGGMIDCESFWKENGRIVVLVNRDTIVTFDRSEVDLRRTLHKKAVKTKKHTVRRHAAKSATPICPPVQKIASSVRSPVQAGPDASGAAKASGPAKVMPMPPREAVSAAPQVKGGTVKSPEGNAPRSQQSPVAKPAEGGANAVPKTAPVSSAVKPPPAKPAPAPPPPPPKEPILSLQTIALGLLLLLLVVALVIRQRKGKGA